MLPPEGTVAPLPTISPVDKQNKKTEPSLGRPPTDANEGPGNTQRRTLVYLGNIRQRKQCRLGFEVLWWQGEGAREPQWKSNRSPRWC